jgi:hypothetical protein
MASGAGGGISSDGSLTIHNSIIAGNSDDGTAPDFKATGNLAVESSIIGDTTGTTLTPGDNNQLNVDFTTVIETEVVNGNTVPLLTGRGGSRIGLLHSSPAIDAGNNALSTRTPFDGDFIPGAIVDIGASEYSEAVIVGTGNVSAELKKSNLFITGDSGDNIVDVSQSGSTVTVTGLFGTLINGSTSETFNVSLADINIKLPDGHNRVKIGGATLSDDLKVKGGKGIDEIYIVDSNIASDINVKLGDGDYRFSVADTDTKRIKAKTGNDFDWLAFVDVNVNTDFLVNTGNWADYVVIKGVAIGDDVNLVAGSDRWGDEILADDFHVADVLKISLGAGSDRLWMKDSSGGKTTLNGGSDYDQIELISSTFASKVEKGVEFTSWLSTTIRPAEWHDLYLGEFASDILIFA